MHWAGLYRTRWGIQGGSPVGHPAAAEVVEEQERRWVSALSEAWDLQGRRSEFEAQAWHAYEVLQALDFFSLAISLLDLKRPSDAGEALPMPGTLPLIDQPPGARTVPRVPLSRGGDSTDIRLWVSAPGRVALDPYPFASVELSLELLTREMADQNYGSADESAAAFHETPLRSHRLVVAPN
jgi:hypothetical protein